MSGRDRAGTAAGFSEGIRPPMRYGIAAAGSSFVVDLANRSAQHTAVAKKGICGICGKGGKLSDEHIPPQCAGNVRGVSLNTLSDWIEAGEIPEKMANAQPRPKGTLWATICERCNNEVLGSWYVPDFCRFVQGSTHSLAEVFRGQFEELKKKRNLGVTLKTGSLRPLCVVKVIAGMILAMNADVDEAFRTRHERLAAFVLDRDSPLPDPYRAYLAVHSGNYATFAPTMLKGIGMPPSKFVAFSAVEQPPFAYLMTFDEENPDSEPFLPMGGLANFASAPYELIGRADIDLLVGFREHPIPGDYGQDS